MKYKFRAECSNDVVQFITNTRNKLYNYNMQTIQAPDVEFEFETKMELHEIIAILMNITDGHVMYQTVQPLEKYTGERLRV